MSSDDVKGAAKSAASSAAAKAQDLGESAKAQAADASSQAQNLADQASEKAGQLYGLAKDQVQNLSDKIPNTSEAYRAGQRVYAQGSAQVGRHVAKQPIEALLLAGAIGYLVGWATSRS